MAVPKRKTSKSKTRSRRANHDRTTLPNIAICSNCGADMISHRACSSCGWYRGRQAMPIAKEETVVDTTAE